MGAMVVALGFAVLFNFVILRVKWNKGSYADVAVDVGMLVLLNSVFGGSILGVVSATAGSTLISLYLMWQPVALVNESDNGAPSEIDEALHQMQERIDALTKRRNK